MSDKFIGQTSNGIPYSQAEAEAYSDAEDDNEPTVRHRVWGMPLIVSLLTIVLIALFTFVSVAVWGPR